MSLRVNNNSPIDLNLNESNCENHKGENHRRCKYCEKLLSSPRNRKNHERIHTGSLLEIYLPGKSFHNFYKTL